MLTSGRLRVAVPGLALALAAIAGCSHAPTRAAAPAGPPVVAATPTRPAATASPAQAPSRPAAAPATVADAAVARLALADSPGGAAALTLSNPTAEAQPLVMLVRQRQGDWLRVQVPVRPNERTGWVRAADVRLRSDPWAIRVEVGARRLTLTRDGAGVLSVPVAVGTGGTPTPLGSFYVDAAVRLTNPNGPYGAYEMSVAGFSNVLRHFGGGNGQIAIHGTNDPTAIGTPVSHGCVRLSNPDVTAIASQVPTGTPVTIVA